MEAAAGGETSAAEKSSAAGSRTAEGLAADTSETARLLFAVHIRGRLRHPVPTLAVVLIPAVVAAVINMTVAAGVHVVTVAARVTAESGSRTAPAGKPTRTSRVAAYGLAAQRL